MEIVNKLYKDWSPVMKQRFRNLTLKFGTMRYLVSANVCDTFVMLDGDLVIGWAIYSLEPWYKSDPGDFMLYVRCRCRRNGVGRALTESAIKKYGSLKVHLWDERSGKFYSKMYYSDEFRDKLEVVRGSRWLKEQGDKSKWMKDSIRI